MIINPSEDENFCQRWQHLERVHCGSRFTVIKILKYLLPQITFVFPVPLWEKGWMFMSFVFCRIFVFLGMYKIYFGGSGGMLGGIQELQIRPQSNSFSGK